MYAARRNTTSILPSVNIYFLCRARAFVGAIKERKTFKGIQPGFVASHTYYVRSQARKTSEVREQSRASFFLLFPLMRILDGGYRFRYLHDREDAYSKIAGILK